MKKKRKKISNKDIKKLFYKVVLINDLKRGNVLANLIFSGREFLGLALWRLKP